MKKISEKKLIEAETDAAATKYFSIRPEAKVGNVIKIDVCNPRF